MAGFLEFLEILLRSGRVLGAYLVEEYRFLWIAKHASSDPHICKVFLAMPARAAAIVRKVWIFEGVGIVLSKTSSILFSQTHGFAQKT